MAPRSPVIQIIIRKEDALLPAMFNLLYSSANQQLLENNFCNQYSHYEKFWTIFVMNGSHYVPTTKSTLFAVSKDEWDTKEGTDKSMKNPCSFVPLLPCSFAPLLL